MRLMIFLALIFSAHTADAGVYKWVDSSGKVHYSDKPSSANSERLKGVDVKIEDQSHAVIRDNTSSSEVIVGENAAYCADLVRKIKYNKQGGSMVVVEKQAGTGRLSYREATQDIRKKNLDILQSDFNKYCEAN